MLRLTREARFSLSEPTGPVLNSWAGWPSTLLLRPYLALRITVEGRIDPITGFFCNIKELDERVRRLVIPRLVAAMKSSDGRTDGPAVLPSLFEALTRESPPDTRLVSLDLFLTPKLRVTFNGASRTMISLTQSFEFSASHRLFCSTMNEQENFALFGKCANPNGHGHNYVVDVTLSGSPDARTGAVFDLDQFERIVRDQVIDRFDHKHLNADCEEFARLNPTVENIATTLWDLLKGRFGAARLSCVRVWETPKTYAEFREDSTG